MQDCAEGEAFCLLFSDSQHTEHTERTENPPVRPHPFEVKHLSGVTCANRYVCGSDNRDDRFTILKKCGGFCQEPDIYKPSTLAGG